MMNKKISSVSMVFLMILMIPYLLTANRIVVIKAKKIYTASDRVFENSMILIKDGKILRVGEHIFIPEGAVEIQADIVIPGLVDIHSHLGVYSVLGVKENEDGNEMTDPITPQVRALDSFNFEDPALETALAGGITTIVSRPGSGNVIGGTSVAVKLKKASPGQMVLKEICDLKMAIEGNPIVNHESHGRMPTSMMGVYFLARKAFVEAQEYMKKWEIYEQDKRTGKNIVPPTRDIGKDSIVLALKREIPVHIHVATASEIMSAIRLADEFNFELTLAHCYWAYLIKDELVKKLAGRKDIHFNVGPVMFFSDYENMLRFNNCPAILADAGLDVSLHVDAVAGRQPGQEHFMHLAALCVRYGMEEEDALKALTIRGAEAVNLDNRIGSIEEGKDADLVFLDGEPFEFFTSVEMVMIDGRIEYKREAAENVQFATSIPQARSDLFLPNGIDDSGTYALKGGTIFTMAGPRIQGGIVLVKDGKIERVGKNISLPLDMPVIDASEFVIIPGLISARSQIGISYTPNYNNSIDEISSPIVPEMEVKHAIEPQDPIFTASRRLGVTAIMVTPGNRNVIGGQGVVLKTAGTVVDKMIVKDKAVMVFSLGNSAKRKDQMPTTRMGVAALLRQTLRNAQDYKNKLEKHMEGETGSPPPRNFSMKALLPVLKREMPAMVHCERLDDILTALRIADEFNLKIMLTGAADAYKAVNEIKKRNIPVVLESIFRGGGNLEDKDFTYKNAAILSQADVKVNFMLGDAMVWYTPLGLIGADPLEIAAFSYKHGMSEEAALRSITIDAARIIGCENRIGSIEPGKDADMVILRGHPFNIQSVPEAVFINGKIVYQRDAEGNR